MLLALAAATLAVDALLHAFDLVWIGRYLGIPGVALILASLIYSARKRKLISWGKPATLLRQHERLAWAGSLLILVHAGIHFNAWLGWLAIGAMAINIGSGLTGKYLLQHARKSLLATKAALVAQGLSSDELDERTYRDTITLGVIQQWRVIHLPITLAFAVLALAHVVSICLFWR
ncbi:MAG: hypothetical protein K2Y20_04355 [Sphingomonas sp.]|nr:hypothetical protein [Sphingomonas sp.]